jgi:hypothetical protein
MWINICCVHKNKLPIMKQQVFREQLAWCRFALSALEEQESQRKWHCRCHTLHRGEAHSSASRICMQPKAKELFVPAHALLFVCIIYKYILVLARGILCFAH